MEGDINRNRFSDDQSGQLIVLLKILANGYADVSQQSLGDLQLTGLVGILLDTYPEHYFDLVDLLGYLGGDAAREELMQLARANSGNDRSWATVNALNHCQSRRLDDIVFLADYFKVANEGGKLAALEGIAARLGDIGLQRQDDPESLRDPATFQLIDHARITLRSAEEMNDSMFTEILSETKDIIDGL